MGCLNSRERLNRKRSDKSDLSMHYAKVLDSPLRATGNPEEIAKEILVCRDQERWESIFHYISSTERIQENGPYKVESIGDLSLKILSEGCVSHSEAISQTCKDFMDKVLENLHTPLILSTIEFLFSIFSNENDELKEFFMRVNIFKKLIELYKNENIEISIGASSLASTLYAGNLERQKVFFDLKGEQALAQLVMKHKNYDQVLKELLDDLLDLVYVTSRQIDEGYAVKPNLDKIWNTGLLEILEGINFNQRQEEIRTKYNQILECFIS